jgi:predicted Zn-dependent protease
MPHGNRRLRTRANVFAAKRLHRVQRSRSRRGQLRSVAIKFYVDSVTCQRGQAASRLCVSALLAACLGIAGWAQSSGGDKFSDLLKQGFELHRQARFAEAIPVLERARRLEPQDYFANLLLGIDLLRIGKPAEAVPRLQLAARVRPGEEFPEDYLGEAEAGLGEYALAAEAYQRAVARGHGSEQALEAWAGFALERFRAIGSDLRASQQGIAAARRLREAAAKPLTAQSCADPIPLLEKRLAVKRAALDVDTAYKLSICYAVEAGKAAAGLQAADDDLAAVHRVRGDVLLRLKEDAAAARAEYRQAIANRPGDPALLERLAEAQLSAGDTEGARQSAQAALAVDPHRREAMQTLASLAMNDRDYEKALPWLRQLSSEAPSDHTVQVELGKALAGTGDAQDALHWLNEALAAGYPDEKGALHALEGRELRILGRDAEAAKVEAEARRLSDAYQARATAGAHGSPDEDQ